MLSNILMIAYFFASLLLVKASNGYYKGQGLPQCNIRRLDESPKIIGGQSTKPLEFPWQTSLQVKYLSSHICGASLISDQWVLTAAHCFRRSSSPSNWVVKVGKHNLNQVEKTERQFDISRIFIHENYSSSNQINDITLLKLAKKVDFNDKDSHLKPICLALKSTNLPAGRTCVATGWGKSKDNNKSCLKAWPGIEWPISDGHVCSGNLKEERGVCTGDSGGPLQCMANDGQWVQVGVASWTSNPCASKGYPSVFTRVSHYYDWILNKISNN